ncbi:MAG: S1 RNA-binding domain-containing protein [Anaerolineae bacterium]|nr:S1 RNA-binding domain-containing protein [Anaerolineae bacterium]
MDSDELGSRPGDDNPMWELLSNSYTYVSPRRGDIRDATILSVRPGEIIVDIGTKEDAFVGSREVERLTPEELAALHVGDTVKAYVLRHDSQTGVLLVSLRLAAEQQDWFDAQELLESGELVRVTVTHYNKGGLLGAYKSLQGFIPASQVLNLRRRSTDESPAEVFEPFVGRELVVKIIEVNRQRRRLILSERAAAREWRDQRREELLEELQPGEIRSGTVSNLVDFGAFVDLGGIDGLVHISELSWGRVDHPREVLRMGDQVQVMVLNVDRERQRIALSIKRTLPDPWSSVAERYEAGQLTRGVVTHLVTFGAFVELEPGIEGLVHISELADGDFGSPENVVGKGQELQLLILGVDPDEHRISLSLRQVPVVSEPEMGEGAPEEAPAEEGPAEEFEPSDELEWDAAAGDPLASPEGQPES